MLLRDPSLAPLGRQKIEWARQYMPVLNELNREFEKDKPFSGVKITVAVHLEAKTACLCLALAAGGAEVHATGTNPLSTQDDVAAGLAAMGVSVFAQHGCTPEEYERQLKLALECRPDIFLDDGGDLVELLHGACEHLSGRVVGGTEETTTGIHRLHARQAAGKLRFPVLAANDAQMKYLFDNRYGTGQSTLAAVMSATNLQVTGKVVVVAGYGWCGRGVAMRAAGLGARVIVTEVDPVKAIEAVMDGFQVMTMDDAAPLGDFFITVTGNCDIIVKRHFDRMKNGAVLANAGHFDIEVDAKALRETATEVLDQRKGIQGYRQSDGRVLNLLAEGRLVNLGAGDGHPVEIMDMTFAVQALGLKYMWEHGKSLAPGVHDIPPEIDSKIALCKLSSQGTSIDTLTPKQIEYMNSF